MNNKKGFTLIEILVTISVVIVVMFLVVPTIITTMDRSKDKQYEGVIKSVEAAASEYVTNNKKDFNELVNVGDNECIELSQLKEEGLINQKLINPKIDEEFPNDLGTLIRVGTDKKLTYRVLEGNCATVNNITVDVTVGLRTSSSIGIIVNARTTSDEVVGYYYSKDNGATWSAMQTTNTYTFTGLTKDTTYSIKVRAVDINEIDGQATITAKTTNIGAPTYAASTSNWTSGNITVTITYPGNKEDNWVYEYKKDNGSWTTVTGTSQAVTFTENGYVIGRIVDTGNNNNTVTASLFEVTKIDKTTPIIASVVLNSITSSSIKAVASATDNETGIKGYYFSKDNGATWSPIQTTNTYTFTGLTKNTIYPIKVKVVNNVNQETISSVVNGTTTNIGVPTYTASTNNWTSGNVTVTITYPENKEDNWVYEYKKDDGSWTTVSGTSQAVTFTENGYVIARIRDTGNNNNTVTASVFEITKIDSDAPSIASIVLNAITSSSIKVVASANATASGIKGYYFSKDNGSTWTTIQTTNTYTFTGLTKNTTYPIKVKVVNNVDRETTSNVVNGKTTNITLPTYTANPSTWTSGNVVVTITYPSSKESGWTYQHQKDGGTWTTVSGTSRAVTFTENGYVIARITDGTNTVTASLFEVSKIDKTGPITSVTINSRTSSSITVVASASDNESGIKGYYFSKDNGVTWTGIQYTNTYTFPGLIKGTTYPIKVKVVNNVNKETTSNAVNGTTTNIATPTYAMNPNPWARGNATVTVTYPSSKEANWVYEYQKDGGSWTTVSGTSQVLTFTVNGYVIARIRDTGNTNNVVTASIFEAIKREPILMRVMGNNGYSSPYLRSPIIRSQIETLEIVTTNIVPTDASVLGSYDVSEAGDGSVMLWYKQGTGNLYKVYIGGEGGVYANPNSSHLFSYLVNLSSLNIQHLDTTRTTNMGSMFSDTWELSSLEFGSNFVTNNVTSMQSMFIGMTNLTTIKHSGGVNNVINFNTSNVRSMYMMFRETGLSSLEFGPNFVTNNVTSMSYMFAEMPNLTTIKHSGGANNAINFDTRNVTTMSNMFYLSNLLSTLEFGPNFVTNNVTDMRMMFDEMPNLTTIKHSGGANNVINFDTSNVTSVFMMFRETGLSSLEFGPNFVTNNVTSMSYMFAEMPNLTTIKHSGGANNVINFDTRNVKIMDMMFYRSDLLSTLEFGPNFVTNNVTDMRMMFFRRLTSSTLSKLNIKYFDFSNVTSFGSMLGNVERTCQITVNSAGNDWLNNNGFSSWNNRVIVP